MVPNSNEPVVVVVVVVVQEESQCRRKCNTRREPSVGNDFRSLGAELCVAYGYPTVPTRSCPTYSEVHKGEE